MNASGAEFPSESENRLREVGRYTRVGRAHGHGLVILSMGIPYWLMPSEEGDYGLFVEKEHEEEVREQLSKFDRENRYWPPREDLLPTVPGTAGSISLYALLIWGIFFVTDERLLQAGSASEEAILTGEWWRAITALTLHGDWAHLIGNTAGGLLFFGLVFRFMGHGLGWLLILFSGAGGNLLNAWGYAGSGHVSIGASTAVFGALGIVTAFRIVRQFRLTGWQWPRHLWVPLVGGLVLLGFLGAGGERTDVLAHGWGFVVGVGLGAGAGYCRLEERFGKQGIQRLLAWVAVLAVMGAWFLSLA